MWKCLTGHAYIFQSIIFSCWTSTLNLVSKYLEQDGIPFLRIDGETPTKRRQKLLDQFDDGTVRVLIMTTGTGAFGQALLFTLPPDLGMLLLIQGQPQA